MKIKNIRLTRDEREEAEDVAFEAKRDDEMLADAHKASIYAELRVVGFCSDLVSFQRFYFKHRDTRGCAKAFAFAKELLRMLADDEELDDPWEGE